jgi:hypothetical protein
LAILEYNLRAVGEADIARSLAVVERRFVAHAAKINRTLAIGGGSIRSRAATASAAVSETEKTARATKAKFDDAQRKIFESTKRYETSAHRLRLRHVETEQREKLNKLRAFNRAAVREQEAARGSFKRAMGGGAMSGVGALGSVGKAGLATLGVGGSVLAASAVHETFKLDEQIRRFVVAGRDSGSVGQDPEAIRRKVTATGLARGIDPAAVMAGVAQFQTVTGRGDVGMQMADTFATFGQATGGDPAEIADAAASLFQNLKIQDIDALTEALAKLTFQGKKGSFEFKDLAAQLPRVTAGLAGRGIGGGAEGVSKMGAALQIVQRGTGDAAVTSTAIDAVFRQMVAKAKEIQSGAAFGGKKTNIFEGGKATNAMRGDIDVLIADVLKASGGDAIKLQKIFGDEGMKGMNPFISEFRGAGGGDAGHAAVLKMFAEFADVTGNYKEIQRDAADVQKATSIQFQIAMMELKQVMVDELVPAAKEFAPRVRDLGPPLRVLASNALQAAKAFGENPAAGIGAILAGGIAMELGKAQLAQLVTTGIVSPLGVAGLAITAFAGSALAAKAYIDGKYAEAQQKVEDAAKSGEEINAKAEAEIASTGRISPETRAQLDALDATQRATRDKSSAVFKEGFGDTAGRAFNQFFTDDPRNLDEKARLETAGGNEKYTDSVIKTRRLQAADDAAKQFGAKDFKAAEVGAAIGAAAVEAIQKTSLNRTNSPSPVKG